MIAVRHDGREIEMMAAGNAAYAEFALAAAREAGAAILPHFRVPIAVDDKGGARGYDPVTEADRGAEDVIRKAITRALTRTTASRARSTASKREPRRSPG